MKLVFAAMGLLVIGACGVGDDGPSGPTDPRLCATEFNLTGQYTVGIAPPDNVNNDTQQPPGDGIPDIQGCWPTGTWTFTLTPGTPSKTDTACTPAPTLPTAITF